MSQKLLVILLAVFMAMVIVPLMFMATQLREYMILSFIGLAGVIGCSVVCLLIGMSTK